MTDDEHGAHEEGHGGADHGHEHDEGHAHGHDHGNGDADGDLRVTSPMQGFTTGQVGVGFAILLVGLAVTFGLPLLLA